MDKPFFTETRQRWLLLLLTAFTFFVLLGSRALNEPDEGRYSEIAREMIETGDWVVPHLWYLPHLDKPPLTYWLVAVSMKWFGQNEWAARLPLALAGIGGVWAVWLLGCSVGGRRVGFWSALILQTSLLYFVMARMLTTDMFLTLFNTWAIYFFWRSWQSLNSEVTSRKSEFFSWHLAGWVAIALGFSTKGPIALAIPLAALAALVIYRWKSFAAKKLLWSGLVVGLVLFVILVLPWFLLVFRRVPESFHYMTLGQAAGHLLGTTIKDRKGSLFYFFGILAVGLLPWTWLLGWLWRRAYWCGLDPKSKDGWVLLNTMTLFTFALFSFSQAKLPPYILPIFPALAVMLAWRFFGGEPAAKPAAALAWRFCLVSSLLLPAVFPPAVVYAFHNPLPGWMKWQTPVAAGIILFVLWLTRKWKPPACAVLALGLALFSMIITVAEIPLFQNSLKRNSTLKPLGLTLRENCRPGDVIVCWGQLPEGLPFYAYPAISATSRPYFGDMNLAQVPFEFPGNQKRLGDLLLPDESALANLLAENHRIWIAGFNDEVEHFLQNHPATPLTLVTNVGQWKLFVNR
ncbi:MAG TPA: glycosyltransferase family 39 protein [Verrucomicrobiae bacterium]|nr:glycosyltransferase family 39 protein [Verrucomicrobiae bacterium]